jgi:hypothetical protein
MTCVAPISRLRFVSGADEKVVRVFDATRGFARSMKRLGVTGDDLESVCGISGGVGLRSWFAGSDVCRSECPTAGSLESCAIET